MTHPALESRQQIQWGEGGGVGENLEKGRKKYKERLQKIGKLGTVCQLCRI